MIIPLLTDYKIRKWLYGSNKWPSKNKRRDYVDQMI